MHENQQNGHGKDGISCKRMTRFLYDKDADVFYFSQGDPSAADETIEAGNDVLLHVNPRTKKVRGFTLMNASRRGTGSKQTSLLPFSIIPTVR